MLLSWHSRILRSPCAFFTLPSHKLHSLSIYSWSLSRAQCYSLARLPRDFCGTSLRRCRGVSNRKTCPREGDQNHDKDQQVCECVYARPQRRTRRFSLGPADGSRLVDVRGRYNECLKQWIVNLKQ